MDRRPNSPCLGTGRISSLVLVGAVGIQVDGHPVADVFPLSMRAPIELLVEQNEEAILAFGHLMQGQSGLTILLVATGVPDGDVVVGRAHCVRRRLPN
jgi:hypothetical protein